jgi:hypothetical protein
MPENHTPKKNNLSLILKVSIVLLILAGVCSAVFYQYIYLPGKIASSVNTNADIFNAVIRDNNALAIKSEVKLSGKTATSSSELSRQIENAKNIQTTTDNLSQKIEDTSKKLDDGPNTDSKEYATIVRESLNQRLALTKENSAIQKTQICNASKMLDFASKLELVVENMRQISGMTDENSIVKTLNDSAQSIDDGNKSLSTIKDCFEGDFAKYYDAKISADIESDSKLYANFSSLLRKLATSVTTKDIALTENTTNEIIKISNEKSKLIENANLQNALEEITEEALLKNQAQIEKESQIDKKANTLKQKYNLELK